MAVAHIRLVIKDFSFMKVTEVDPVNYAAVIGAAGGAWRKFGFRYEAWIDYMGRAEGSEDKSFFGDRGYHCSRLVLCVPYDPFARMFFHVFLMHYNFYCPLCIGAHREPETVGTTALRQYRYAACSLNAFLPAEILCIVFGLLFVLDHKVPPQKVRRRRKKTKKRKATGPSSARGQLASASGPTTLQAVR